MTEAERLRHLEYLKDVEWSVSKGETRDYSAYVLDGDRMYVKIEPGGFVHKHKDHGLKTHYVIQSDNATSWVNGMRYNLEQGSIYEFDSGLEHESFNEGSIDRIHYVVAGPYYPA